ncbi:hypothetical protein ES703_113140 [subsurface metagenome]
MDAWETLFTPCAYRIGEVRFTGGGVPPCAGSLKGIASFRGRFCEQAQVGERVRARGKLEKITSKDGENLHRLLLGKPGDFMVVI